MIMKVVEVKWRDACYEKELTPLDIILDMGGLIRYNIGYLIQEDESGIVIVFGQIDFHNDKKAYEHVMIIPRAMIIRVETLRNILSNGTTEPKKRPISPISPDPDINVSIS